MAAVVGRARSCTRGRSCVVGHAWSVMRGRSGVVGHAWSFVVVRGRAWSVVRGRARSLSHCRRFDWLIFAVLSQSVRLSITAVVAAPTRRWPFNRDRIVTGAAGPSNSQMREGRLS